MLIQFREEFAVPSDVLYGYFQTPTGWCRLYEMFGPVADLGDGWYSVPLKNFPFPLVAKILTLDPKRLVHWSYRGFWRGEGKVRFTESHGKVLVEGYENISVRWLYFLSPIVEKLLLEQVFKKIWDSGWQHIRKLENISQESSI
jgi:hypothetical protein